MACVFLRRGSGIRIVDASLSMFSLTQVLAPILVFVIMAGSGAPSNTAASKARDAQRRADVHVILNAVWQYSIDHNGALPPSIPARKAQEICPSKNPVKPCVDLSVLADEYLETMRADPQAPAGHTWYTIVKSDENRVTVQAPHAEVEPVISLTR